MGKRLKKLLVIPLILVMIFTAASCDIFKNVGLAGEVEDTATRVIKALAKQDDNALLDLFSDELKTYYKHDKWVQKDLDKVYKFIDGDIVEYEYKGSGRGDQKTREYDVIYYLCTPEFSFSTNTGRKYTLKMKYYHIDEADPKKVGVSFLTVTEDDQSVNNFINVGKREYEELK